MNRRTLLMGFGVLGATALSGGGTVYALNVFGLAPKAPPAIETAAKDSHGAAVAKDDAHADAPHWSYDGATGPDRWGDLEDGNALCKLGGAQSPVDLSGAMRVAALAGLQTAYGSTRVKVTNNGHTFQVNADKGSTLTLDGKKYDLLQFHFHTPSEHTVDGKSFPLEMHLVHQAADKSLAVIGVFIAEGSPNVVLGKFWEKMPKAQGEVDTGVSIDIKELLPRATDEYFTYAGSLTTPPCSESVRWVVLKQPIQASKTQIASFRTVFAANARPTLPLGARHLLSS